MTTTINRDIDFERTAIVWNHCEGQTLVDAIIAIGLLAMTTLAVVQISGIAYKATLTTATMSDSTQLYNQLVSMASTSQTCIAGLGSGTQPYTSIQTIYTTPPISTTLQGYTQFGRHLTINQILIYPSDNPPPVPGTFPAELAVNVTSQQLGSNTNLVSKTIRGIYLTVQVDSSGNIISCSPLSLTAGGNQNVFPSCNDAYHAPTSTDGVTVQCGWVKCPPTYIQSIDGHNNLVCSTS